METVLYDANWKKVQIEPETGPVKSLRRYLAFGWGRICRAGVSSPFRWLKAIYGVNVRISFLTPSLNFLRSLRGKQACAYSYLKVFPKYHIPYTTYHIRSFLFGMANGLIILSLAGLILTFYPVIQVELAYRLKKAGHQEPPVVRAYFGDLLNSTSEVSLAAEGGNSSTSEVSFLYAPDPEFSLVIPKIDAKAKIIANVDPNNPESYGQALKKGVAHGAGWGFPGSGETIWLFAHSTDTPFNVPRYNAVFYLLRKLEPGDKVIVFFANKRFNYQVVEKKIVEASETSFLKNQGEERLILQTCWPPGTSLKRLIVLAKPSVF